MPYFPDDRLAVPSSKDAKVWRYMSLAKFLSLLTNSDLHFSSVWRLRESVDAMEGMMTEAEWKSLIARDPEDAEEVRALYRHFADLAFVSCWHVRSHESMGIWRWHVGTCDGVAVQSTFGRLCDCLSTYDRQVRIGLVEYADYATQKVVPGNALKCVYRKRQEYDVERELRISCFPYSGPVRGGGLPEWERRRAEAEDLIRQGEKVRVHLPTLIERILVAPKSAHWLDKLLQMYVASVELDPDIVVHSRIDRPPEHDHLCADRTVESNT